MSIGVEKVTNEARVHLDEVTEEALQTELYESRVMAELSKEYSVSDVLLAKLVLETRRNQQLLQQLCEKGDCSV